MIFLVFGVSFKIVMHHKSFMKKKQESKNVYIEILWDLSEYDKGNRATDLLGFGANMVPEFLPVYANMQS
jgi:hypothetical protein